MVVVIPVDDFSPISVGDTGAPCAPVFLHKGDNSPVSLVGATISMIMVSATIVRVCIGDWIIDDETLGRAHYLYTNADVSTSGTWTLYIVITIAGEPVHADVKTLQILSIPVAP
jgi:hypothetical protein